MILRSRCACRASNRLSRSPRRLYSPMARSALSQGRTKQTLVNERAGARSESVLLFDPGHLLVDGHERLVSSFEDRENLLVDSLRVWVRFDHLDDPVHRFDQAEIRV